MPDNTPNSTQGQPLSQYDSFVPAFQDSPEFQQMQQNINNNDAAQAKYGTFGQELITSMEQLASGASLGSSKVWETHLMGVDPKDIAGRAAANPATSMASNIAGTAGMIYATGGLGGLAEGAGALSRIGLAAAEGAGIGGINSAMDDWSQNKSLDAEKIVASAGFGALLGGGGAGIIEGLKLPVSGLNKAIDYFKGLAPENPGESYVGNIIKGAQTVGQKPADFVRALSDHFNTFLDTAEEAKQSAWNAGREQINTELANMPLEQAQMSAKQAMANFINASLEQTEEGVAPTPQLSPTVDKVVQKGLMDLNEAVDNAQSAAEVHELVSDFSRDFAKNIKWDKMPTAGQQIEQGVLKNMRAQMRADLTGPDWGNAGPVYQQMNDNWSQSAQAIKDFNTFFTRKVAEGRVIDPIKLNSFLKDPSAPGNILRWKSMEGFVNSVANNAGYVAKKQGLSMAADTLWQQVVQFIRSSDEITNKTKVLQTIKDARSGHTAGIGTLAALEALPLPSWVKGGILAIQRYWGKEGAYVLGGDINTSFALVQALAKHAAATTSKIENGARLIFTSSASQAGQD